MSLYVLYLVDKNSKKLKLNEGVDGGACLNGILLYLYIYSILYVTSRNVSLAQTQTEIVFRRGHRLVSHWLGPPRKAVT